MFVRPPCGLVANVRSLTRTQAYQSDLFLCSSFSRMRLCTASSKVLRRKSASQSPAPATAAEFAQIAPMVLLRQALRQHADVHDAGAVGGARDVISRAVFNHYCAESHVGDSDEALKLLEACGSVVSISNGEAVHLRPLRFLQMYEARAQEGNAESLSCDFFLDEAKKRLAAAQLEEAAMRRLLEPALKRAAAWRRLVWGGMLFFVGAQMAVVSRLTFVEFDWDVMEPFTYFFGAATSILFFLYFVRHGRSHAYAEYDRTMLSRRVMKYAPPEFDWEHFETVVRKVDEERRMLEKIRNWVREH